MFEVRAQGCGIFARDVGFRGRLGIEVACCAGVGQGEHHAELAGDVGRRRWHVLLLRRRRRLRLCLRLGLGLRLWRQSQAWAVQAVAEARPVLSLVSVLMRRSGREPEAPAAAARVPAAFERPVPEICLEICLGIFPVIFRRGSGSRNQVPWGKRRRFFRRDNVDGDGFRRGWLERAHAREQKPGCQNRDMHGDRYGGAGTHTTVIRSPPAVVCRLRWSAYQSARARNHNPVDHVSPRTAAIIAPTAISSCCPKP